VDFDLFEIFNQQASLFLNLLSELSISCRFSHRINVTHPRFVFLKNCRFPLGVSPNPVQLYQVLLFFPPLFSTLFFFFFFFRPSCLKCKEERLLFQTQEMFNQGIALAGHFIRLPYQFVIPCHSCPSPQNSEGVLRSCHACPSFQATVLFKLGWRVAPLPFHHPFLDDLSSMTSSFFPG